MNIKTYNIKIIGDNDLTQYWITLLETTKEAYNYCANMIKENNITLSLVNIHNNCYNTLRQNFNTLPAQTIIRIQKEVLAAYKSKKSNKHNGSHPQKHNLSMTLDKRLYSNFTSEGISVVSDIPNKRKRFTFKLYPKISEMFQSASAKDPLIFVRNNELYLSIPFEVQHRMLNNDNCIGVDMGVKRLFTTSEGNAFKDKTYLKNRRKIRYLKSILHSKKTNSAKRHLKSLRKHEHNLSKYMCHRACNALLSSTNASYIVLEDLTKIKKSTSKSASGYKRTRHNNMLSQVPFYMFKEILTYKATLAGKQVVSVSPQYTSQIDCRTNKRDGNRVGCRYYCSDGVVFDADWNASVNIAQKSNHPLSNDCLPFDGKLHILNGREMSTSHML